VPLEYGDAKLCGGTPWSAAVMKLCQIEAGIVPPKTSP
jgi:hypothetical protein